ncbi:hypothetical protein [Actinocorallia herbida]|uniref:hypothetical protein n=1 Tax=Actinocorallia herbida TaxID=58109 RepID=UPI000F4D1B73|nr:hypothetical protein [Actinocorallia herbida]
MRLIAVSLVFSPYWALMVLRVPLALVGVVTRLRWDGPMPYLVAVRRGGSVGTEVVARARHGQRVFYVGTSLRVGGRAWARCRDVLGVVDLVREETSEAGMVRAVSAELTEFHGGSRLVPLFFPESAS